MIWVDHNEAKFWLGDPGRETFGGIMLDPCRTRRIAGSRSDARYPSDEFEAIIHWFRLLLCAFTRGVSVLYLINKGCRC